MKTYSKNTRLFCDFHFGGKPKAICKAVLKPGNGKDKSGTVLVKLTETVGAYRKGEELELSTFYAVPTKQEFRKRESCFRWVNTNYQWE
jgi:hypothetical protein